MNNLHRNFSLCFMVASDCFQTGFSKTPSSIGWIAPPIPNRYPRPILTSLVEPLLSCEAGLNL